MLNTQPSYEIIETSDPRLEEMLDTRIRVEKCLTNSANIYHLGNDNFVIVPEIIGKYAILYYDRSTLDEHIENGHFPLPGPELDDILETEKENIVNIHSCIENYMKYVEERFDLDTNIKNSRVEDRLAHLNERVNSYKVTNLSDFDLLSIGLYVNEIFRIETKSGWSLTSVNTLNPYWIPSITSENGKNFNFFGKAYKSVKENQVLDIPTLYKMQKAYFLGYEPFSKEFWDLLKQH